jgi:hypothetical protein
MLTNLEPHWLVLLFVVTCLAGVAILARIAGWSSLAVKLRAHGVSAGESLRFVTGSLGSLTFPIKYKNCLRLVLNGEGFYLSLMVPFKFASPALFVPWAQVESCAVEQVFSTQVVVFRFRGQWAGLKLRGVAGQLAREAHQRYLASQGAGERPVG